MQVKGISDGVSDSSRSNVIRLQDDPPSSTEREPLASRARRNKGILEVDGGPSARISCCWGSISSCCSRLYNCTPSRFLDGNTMFGSDVLYSSFGIRDRVLDKLAYSSSQTRHRISVL